MIPKTIGPYRLDEPIGQGGMGEVFRGYDERLDRAVALKHVKAGAKDTAIAHERFRREARALARVRHPAVVEVYDWVESEDGDWLVMELVEGRPLGARIEEGALPVLRAVEIARDVAAGLAAVHAHGIVHRDLTPSNVMLLDGSVKILDFGLAKRVVSMDGVPLTETISGRGQLLGTVRFMSPEQAAGRSVDTRSDLFSLGVLLYEMLTGVSPFAGDNAVETLTRICTEAEMPIHRRDPAVPVAVSDLVQRLLRKEPARRLQTADEVTEVLAALAGGLATGRPAVELRAALPASGSDSDVTTPTQAVDWAADSTMVAESSLLETATRSRRRGVTGTAILLLLLLAGGGVLSWWLNRSPRLEVAVAPPRISLIDGSAQEALVAGAVRGALVRALTSLEAVSVPAYDPLQEPESTPSALAQALAAAEAVTADLECAQRMCQITLSRILAASGHVTWSTTFSSRIDDLLVLHNAVIQNLRRGYGERRAKGGSQDLEVRSEDYTEYLQLEQARADKGSELGEIEILHRAQAIQATSPRFLDAYLLEAVTASLLHYDTRDEQYLEIALAASRAAHALAPEDPLPLFQLARTARNAGLPHVWEEALELLDQVAPGSPRVLVSRALALEREGQGEAGLAMMEEATELLPSRENLGLLAMMHYRHGHASAAQEHLERALELSPAHYATRAQLAQIELMNGDPERAVELYRTLVEQSPQVNSLVNLGVAYLLVQRYADAVEVFRRARDMAPGQPFVLLNLADALLLLGHRDQAAPHYRQVLAILEDDPLGDTWQGKSVRAQALAHLGEAEAAVAMAQEAVQRAPDNPQVALEVAMVYALAGERTSAIVNAERAIAGGVEPRWFRFPWFDSLRDSDRFQELVASPSDR